MGSSGRSQAEAIHDVERVRWFTGLGADIRFALRTLRRNPSFTAAAVLTIALAIGANVAIFSAVNAVVLHPLRLPDPERLMLVAEENPAKHWHHEFSAAANYLDWRASVPAFTDIAAYDGSPNLETMTGQGDARTVRTQSVTGNLFATLGARAEVGRALIDAETWDDQPRTIVLSHAMWEREFAKDSAVVGRTIALDGTSYQVVGVMPQSFAFPSATIDAWTSLHWSPSVRTEEMHRRVHWLTVVGRLKPGATVATAASQLGAVTARLQHDFPATNAGNTASITSLNEFFAGDSRLPLLILLGSVAVLLAIACANVANLLLAAASGRQREMAVRVALGAGGFRIARQAFTESLILSFLGGALGLLLGWFGTSALVALQPDKLLPVRSFGIDPTVAVFAVAITTLAGLVFGIGPALWSVRSHPADVLKQGTRGGTGGQKLKRWGEVLIVAELALALTLNVGAGLLVRSFVAVTHVDPGFAPHGVLMVGVNTANTVPNYTAFFDELMGRIRATPGVTDVAMTGAAPLYTGGTLRSTEVAVRGRTATPTGTQVPHLTVSPDYFATLKVPLRRGRVFTRDDDTHADAVIIVNETLARTYFRDEEAIGQSLCFDAVPPPACTWHRIVGVVGDVHERTLEQAPRPATYESSLQRPMKSGLLLIRTSGDVGALANPVRAIIREMQPKLAPSVRTLDEVYGRSISRPRFFAALLGVFAVVGVVLAIVGIYGVVSRLARSRTREMGIRLALGATAGQVIMLFVRHAIRITAAGLLAGGLLAAFATRAMRTMLFGVTPSDPVTIAFVVLSLGVASVAAAWIPAARASRTDPSHSLRTE